jgi:hypothetical protein
VRTTLACALTAAAMSVAALSLPAPAKTGDEVLLAPNSHYLLAKIETWRQRTWHWQGVMGTPRFPTAHLAQQTRSLAFRQWALRLWKGRAIRAKQRALRPPHRRQWLCIHRYEGTWHSNTGNGYYGGLQMDVGFQRRYGRWLLRRKGLAHRWTPVEQIWVAERGRRVQGWHAWPSTARACGLI